MKLWNDRRLRLAITRLGLEYLAAMLMVGLFAVNTGNNLLYLVFSLMVALFLVSGWVSRRTIAGIHLEAIEEGNLFARVRGGIRVRLRDEAPKRIRALELRVDSEGGRIEPGFLPGGEGREDVLVVLHARPDRRGWCRLRSLELRTTYPFGFLEKAWRFPLDQALLVLPHPRVVAPRTGRRGESRKFLAIPGVAAPEGARPFREGDPLSRVHWKRTAQRGVPWVRTFEEEESIGIRLRLDLRLWAPGPAFEKELENLSGAVLQARLQKQEVFLEVQSLAGRTESRGFAGAWRALALAQAEGASPPFSGSSLASSGTPD